MKRLIAIHRQRGFTLIEVLIAVFVMTVGLLSLAALQTRQLTDSHSSKMRQIATAQAYALSDLMRTNRVSLGSGDFNSPGSTVTAACMTAAGCTDAQMAQTGFANWLDQLSRTLPGGTGTVCLDSTPNDGVPLAAQCDGLTTGMYVIKVWWKDEKLTPTDFQRFVTVAVP